PPRLTSIFPYTTLFRSLHMILRREDSVTGTFDLNRSSLLPASRQRELCRRRRLRGGYWNLCRCHCLAVMLKDDGLCFRSKHSWEDRKSTRLNSSHGSIS